MSFTDARVPKVGDQAPDALVNDDQRRLVRLSEEWAPGALVLIFYRGEWSPPCRKQLLEYRDNALSFRKLGARVAAISSDEPAISAYLRNERGLPYDLLCDPLHIAIDRWGLLDRHLRGGVARPATFVIDRAGVVRTRSLDDDQHRMPADAVLLFLRRGGAAGGRPARARLARAWMRLRALESQIAEGLRGLRPRRT